MKHNKYLLKLLSIILLGLIAFGCSEEWEDRLEKTASKVPITRNAEGGLNIGFGGSPSCQYMPYNGVITQSVPSSEKGLNQFAFQYYKDIETAIFATGANKNDGTFNSLRDELEDIHIVDDNGMRVSFFSMTKNEQKTFLDNWVLFQTQQVSEKLKIAPELMDELQGTSKILSDNLKAKAHTDLKGELKVKNNANFFQSIDDDKNNSVRFYGHTSGGGGVNVDFETARKILAANTNKGYLLIRLAKEDCPGIVYYNGSWGHVAILTEKVLDNMTEDSIITIAANTHDADGNKLEKVRYEKLHEWCKISYVVGLQYVEYDKKGEIKSIQKITDLSQMANMAATYLGVPYASGKAFTKAAKHAPNKFTCATLAWWCARENYGFEIRSGNSQMISPGEIYRNDHTYLIAKVK